MLDFVKSLFGYMAYWTIRLFLAFVIYQTYHFIHSDHGLFSTCMLQSAGFMPLVRAAFFFQISTFQLFPCRSLSSKILPVFSVNCTFWTSTSSLSEPGAKWHITCISQVYRQCIKNYYLRHHREQSLANCQQHHFARWRAPLRHMDADSVERLSDATLPIVNIAK